MGLIGLYFHPRISLVILLSIYHSILLFLVHIIIMVLDQPKIPLLIFFFILITCLIDMVLILWGEILSWSLMEVQGYR